MSDETLLDSIYYIPREQIKMVVAGKSRGFLFYSSTGLGKTYQTRRTLVGEGLVEGVDFIFICGHLSPLQFYKKLWAYSDKIIVIDDVNILESKTILNMLKATLSDSTGNIVEFNTSKNHLGDIPSQFSFTGKLIILLNNKPDESEDLQAVNGRILNYHLDMDYKIRLNVIDIIAQKEFGGLTADQRLEVAAWIRTNTSQATKNLSIRLLFFCYKFYLWNKERWQDFANSYIENDGYIQLIIRGCSQTNFIDETGMSASTYKRVKRELGLSRPYVVGERLKGSKAHDIACDDFKFNN